MRLRPVFIPITSQVTAWTAVLEYERPMALALHGMVSIGRSPSGCFARQTPSRRARMTTIRAGTDAYSRGGWSTTPRSALHDRVGQGTDARNIYRYHVAGCEAEFVGRYDTRTRQEDDAVGETVVIEEPLDQFFEGALHLVDVGFAAENFRSLAMNQQRDFGVGPVERLFGNQD